MTADLALLANDPSVAEQAADPAQYVMVACERAKGWLKHALDGAHIEEIVEVKSQAEAIRVYTTQKQLGKDAELAAAEVVRRAERGIGLAIRKGQEAGEIARRGDFGSQGEPGRVGARPGWSRNDHLARPSDFIPKSDLANAVYPITDGVTDEEFEDAIDQAKDEGNLSRANVVRKVKGRKSPEDRLARARRIREMAPEGYTSRQMASRLGVTAETVRLIAKAFDVEIPADKLTGKTHNIVSARVARETVFAIEGAAAGLDLIDYDDLDPAEAAEWATSLTESLREINRFAKKIKEVAHGHEQE